MTSMMRGPYVGTNVSDNPEDVSIETTRTKTNGTQRPTVNKGAYVKHAHVALADFDGGDFGTALRTAAATKNGSYGYPTYVNVDVTGTTLEEIRHQVFDGKYWAAIVVEPGASAPFEEALNGTASSYDPSSVYTYYLMEARCYALYAAGIQSTTITTASTAAGVFSSQYAARRLTSGRYENATAAASAIAGPARAVGLNAGPLDYAEMDNKALLNTIGAVMPVLMQFFFIMAWNGICNGMHLYAAYDLRTHVLARFVASIIWPLISNLCSAGWDFCIPRIQPPRCKNVLCILGRDMGVQHDLLQRPGHHYWLRTHGVRPVSHAVLGHL
ncbi:hypothetical protein EK21DRAFT_84713 [Setomelanomma holmii]|uniref:DUF3533 domain-containing protein n=1 Tax=Setomelanomma holmii TaxID=210430 RepID=A0A9P4HKX7_9PLEO|nr:hypothetical protein EK21DRAFT_84713 [Setomelanomma holmii]